MPRHWPTSRPAPRPSLAAGIGKTAPHCWRPATQRVWPHSRTTAQPAACAVPAAAGTRQTRARPEQPRKSPRKLVAVWRNQSEAARTTRWPTPLQQIPLLRDISLTRRRHRPDPELRQKMGALAEQIDGQCKGTLGLLPSNGGAAKPTDKRVRKWPATDFGSFMRAPAIPATVPINVTSTPATDAATRKGHPPAGPGGVLKDLHDELDNAVLPDALIAATRCFSLLHWLPPTAKTFAGAGLGTGRDLNQMGLPSLRPQCILRGI